MMLKARSHWRALAQAEMVLLKVTTLGATRSSVRARVLRRGAWGETKQGLQHGENTWEHMENIRAYGKNMEKRRNI